MNYFELFLFPIIGVVVISYLLGSLNFSIIFTRLFSHNGTDIRKVGSGNAGTTNVLRSVGKLPALLTFVCDFGKGVCAVLIGRFWFASIVSANGLMEIIAQYGAYLAAFFCLIGHIFPVFFKLKGGKGVATCGALIALIDIRVFAICFPIFVLVFLISKIVSLSAIIGMATYPFVTFGFTYFMDYCNAAESGVNAIPFSYVIMATVFSFIISAIVIGKHHANIKRILNGTEKRIIGKKK